MNNTLRSLRRARTLRTLYLRSIHKLDAIRKNCEADPDNADLDRAYFAQSDIVSFQHERVETAFSELNRTGVIRSCLKNHSS